MSTIRDTLLKISELRSKIAVIEGLVIHLKTHYLPSERSEAEMHFVRDDHGRVPYAHVHAASADLVLSLDQIKDELARLEDSPVEEKKEPKPKKTGKKEASDGASS